jgi:catechol 2,3-dioxygenase-like lactoylglutathione lyase family enzyme
VRGVSFKAVLDHISIPVTDLERAAAFYDAVLGCRSA